MSSASRFATVCVSVLMCTLAFAAPPPLRVCADASNLPFSNVQQQGFENVLAHMVGEDLHRQVQFVWMPFQEHFVEKRLKAQTCDLMMGTPSSFDLMVPTRPYYRSTYVFVSRRDRHIKAASLTDASLRNYRIGAHIIGDDDGAVVPPAQEMTRRGMLRNIVGYSIYGHPLSQNPSSEIISAVEHGDIDMAIAWGPLAGYFAQKSSIPLRVVAICPLRGSSVPFQFDISMGVKRGEDTLLAQLNDFIARRHHDIQKLLLSYGVPLVDKSHPRPECR